MPSPFPGMDPYLENPSLFPDFHHELIARIKQTLNDMLHPRYRARVEERVYISQDDGPPQQRIIPDVSLKLADPSSHSGKKPSSSQMVAEPIELITLIEEEVHEAYVAIYDRSGQHLVTIIEVLSPANKAAGSAGLESYRSKRFQIQHSSTHLVEIDLLRSGVRLLDVPDVPVCDYHIHVSEHGRRPRGWVWPILLNQRLPEIRIPLGPQDEPLAFDIQALVDSAYDASHYEAEIDYRRDPVPPLPVQYASWADDLLKAQGLRA